MILETEMTYPTKKIQKRVISNLPEVNGWKFSASGGKYSPPRKILSPE